MKRRNGFALGLAGALLAVCAGPVTALDTREVVVEKNEGLVDVPRHLGQVLATPNRRFSFEISTAHAHWQVLMGFERHGVYRERATYLKHEDNLLHQITYFDFDDDAPIAADAVATRVRHQLGNLKGDGLSFVVVGHADEAGTYAYNMALSERRAKAVMELLVADGHDSSKFQVIGRGKLDPVSFSEQHRNRRVDVIVRGDKQARLAYQKMKKGGVLTCRGCIASPTPRTVGMGAPSPIGEEGMRQPAVATASSDKEAQGAATATVKALQQMEEAAKDLGADAAEALGFRADHAPPISGARGPAPSLQDILSPQATGGQ